MSRQLSLFPMAPTSKQQARDRKTLMAVLNRVERRDRVAGASKLIEGVGYLTPWQVMNLMRGRRVPRLTVPR